MIYFLYIILYTFKSTFDSKVLLFVAMHTDLSYHILIMYITCCSHLGEEVALYCSKYLPDIIKEQKTYKDGKLQKVIGPRS